MRSSCGEHDAIRSGFLNRAIMTSKKDKARIEELSNMVDRLATRLDKCISNSTLFHRQLELMQTRHNYTDEQIDELRKEVINEGSYIE